MSDDFYFVVFKDYSFGFHESLSDFYNNSGCEEFQFLANLECIVNSTGSVLFYNQEVRKVFNHPNSKQYDIIFFEKLIKITLDRKKLNSSEILLKAPKDIKGFLKFFYEYDKNIKRISD